MSHIDDVAGRASPTRTLRHARDLPAGLGVQESAGSGDWQLLSYLELAPLSSAVPCARLHTRQVLWEWELQQLREAAELIVSELVTNSVQASEGLTGSEYLGRREPGLPPVRLWLQSDAQRVLVQVWDGNDCLPVRQDTGPDAIGGRGLLLVEAVSVAWGSYTPERSTGKIVWALAGEC